MRVEVLMYDGVSEIDTIAPFKVFSLARRLGGDIEVAMVTVDGRSEVTAVEGIRIGGLRQWRPEEADVLVVAGGWLEQMMDGDLVMRLREAKEAAGRRLVLAAVCSGTLMLGAAGLLEGRAATTFATDFERLSKWAEVVDARVVDDGDIVSSGSGWKSGFDLALWLIERELGDSQLAVRVERFMGHDRRGTVWRRQG
ncbi:DJ-1/PfpI family protein [Nonomuraea angiospora]|uniref:Transcriptional regulator GlxA family with amidase domain n=1 Tax=Nonomuraea angiospora TaxID=46172 RepID=A0ABR9M236_9ACTN|nr:DJ-1/PfpI family protein [Nonomuraea angiospora]MBE1586972.1 transcriptional regulator GlxA family with amidase domain [Nonomuraea angiospora]